MGHLENEFVIFKKFSGLIGVDARLTKSFDFPHTFAHGKQICDYHRGFPGDRAGYQS